MDVKLKNEPVEMKTCEYCKKQFIASTRGARAVTCSKRCSKLHQKKLVKIWYSKNKDKINVLNREKYKENREKYTDYNKEYRKKNKEKFKKRNNDRFINEHKIYLDELSSRFGINGEMKETCLKIFKTCKEKNIMRGHSGKEVMDYCFIIAARLFNQPIKLHELDIHNNYSFNNYFITIKKTILPFLNIEYKRCSPVPFIKRFCRELKVENATQGVISLYARLIENGFNTSRNQLPLIAMCIYIYCEKNNHRKVTQFQASEMSGVSTVQLRKIRDQMEEFLPMEYKKNKTGE